MVLGLGCEVWGAAFGIWGLGGLDSVQVWGGLPNEVVLLRNEDT